MPWRSIILVLCRAVLVMGRFSPARRQPVAAPAKHRLASPTIDEIIALLYGPNAAAATVDSLRASLQRLTAEEQLQFLQMYQGTTN